MILYHQTDKGNEESIKDIGFEHGRGRAILSDNGVPNGFFFKPSDDDIGLGANSTQIPVYLSLQNPLVADNRRDLMLKVSQMDMNVYEADYQFYLKDKEYKKKFDDLYKEITSDRESFKSRNNELNVILKEWGDWVKSAASNMRELITKALINSNHDGVILKNDVGSFNRSVTSYIAFYPEQIKSINNNGDFNPNEKSIMREKELNEQIKRIKSMMGLTENIDNGDCDCCKYFKMDEVPMMDNLLYFLIEKGAQYELEYISPKQYLMNISRGFKQSYEETMGSAYDENLAKKYAEAMKAGDKFPVGYYTEDRADQEGRHRAAAAMLLGCEKIPVVRRRNVSWDYVRSFVEMYKDSSREELESYVKSKGAKELSGLDWRSFKNYMDYRL